MVPFSWLPDRPAFVPTNHVPSVLMSEKRQSFQWNWIFFGIVSVALWLTLTRHMGELSEIQTSFVRLKQLYGTALE